MHEPVLVRHHFKRNIRSGGFTEASRNQKSTVLCSSGKRLAVKYADQLPIRLLGTWLSILPLALQIHCNSERALALLYSARLRQVTPARLMAERFRVFQSKDSASTDSLLSAEKVPAHRELRVFRSPRLALQRMSDGLKDSKEQLPERACL